MKIIDLHQDLLAHINHKHEWNQSDQTDWDALERNDVKCVVATAFPLPKNENWLDSITNDLIDRDFHEYVEFTHDRPNWELVTGGEQLKRIVDSDDLHGVLMHIEGLNVFPGWDKLEQWYRLGWRSLGIVWNVTNELGGGTKDTTSGLTLLGKEMIDWCARKKMIVDFAHMNEPTFWQSSDVYNGPIVISHGNACALCKNARNYTDSQLDTVHRTGGVIGVFFARSYVTGTDKAGICDVANHIDYIVEKIGIDHVAIGSDFGQDRYLIPRACTSRLHTRPDRSNCIW
jgi:microsomal dipeptidase-like Zn-dependent dipeptidase